MDLEFLVIGQGIAGTFLSYYLEKEKRSFVVIDDEDAGAPSRLAAGIINPVTGRRMVTVWLAEEIIPFAKTAYEEIGDRVQIRAITRKDIVDFFPNPFMRENFLTRLAENNQYTHAAAEENEFAPLFNYEFGCGLIGPAYTAHLDLLLPAWRDHLERQGQLMDEHFDADRLEIRHGEIRYKELHAQKIIFCDGAAAAQNPMFRRLPFAPNKGEALVIKAPGLERAFLFKKNLLLAPLAAMGEDCFWVGSNYAWDFDDANPTETFRAGTVNLLKQWLKIPFEIVEHRAAIRPATLERRPFVGTHPAYPNLAMLNGMGTKGSSLAPFFAKQLTDHLLEGTPIHPEADLRRFQRILARE